jgi:hypothetical protein
MAMTNKALRTADLATTGAKTIADRALRVAHRLQNPQLLVRPLMILRAQPPQPEPP